MISAPFLQKRKYISWARWLLLAAVAYVMVLGFLFLFQRSFIYFPNDTYLTPAEAGQDNLFEEIQVKTEDGITLKGWHHPAVESEKTIIFFHGNADSIRKLSFVADPYIRAGYGFLITEYRGYSGFDGMPTEQGVYADARSFIRALQIKGVATDNMFFFGHSLGTGVATQMAYEFKKAGGLMLLAPLLSVPDMAQFRFPYLPLRYLVWDRFENAEKIPHITAPVLIVHGTWDIVVPFEQGQRLFELAQDPKQFHAVPQGGHNNLFADPFADIALIWLSKISRPRAEEKDRKE